LAGAAANLDRLRQAVFALTLVISAPASLGMIFGAQQAFIQPEKMPLLRVLLGCWLLVIPVLWVVSRRSKPVYAYLGQIAGAYVVLAVVFQCLNVSRFELLGMHFLYQSALMLEALVLLPFAACAWVEILSVAMMVAEALTNIPADPKGASAILALTMPLTALLALTLFASYLLDRYYRRLAEFQLELARQNARLEEEVARRSGIISTQQGHIFQLQKMEAIGRLAGGVAHDFNNLLTPILGCASALVQSSEPGGDVHEAAELIERAGWRAAQLTRQLLGFARRGKLQTVPVDLDKVVHEVGEVVARTNDKRIEQAFELGAPVLALGDPSQLHQVVLNLALNACDAMPQGGRLTFATRVEDLDAAAAAPLEGLGAGRYLVLSVGDTGTGIAPEVRSRIFEPFFTTKAAGQGTGMGLAMVYGIVKNHGGHVGLTTELGKGTTFQVRLPATVREEPQPDARAKTVAKGRGRILVVDDEPLVCASAARILRKLGYQVDMAADGLEAIGIYRQHRGEIDLVLLDFSMPKMTGRECFLALKEIDPKVRALLSSGFGLDGALQDVMAEGMAGFVQKPYAIQELSEAIQRVL
jgi:signal transduction histidine kinase